MLKKKILNFIPNFYFGGVENSNINLTNELRKMGYKVEILTNNILNPKLVNENNLDIKSLNKKKMSQIIFDLFKYIKTQKPDLIICSQFYANIIILIACVISGYKNKLILCERVPVKENLKNIWFFKRIMLKILLKYLYIKADCIVCNSYGTKYELDEFVSNPNTVVIYNPVITNNINTNANSKVDDYDFDPSVVYMTAITRLSYEKNISDMIKIVSRLNNDIKFKFLIIGDGPFFDESRKEVDNLKLNNCIEFLGYKSNPYKYLKHCDIYLSTSKFEGLGNSIIEALHFGLQIVSYKSPGGISEVLDGGNYGELIEFGNIEEFSNYLNFNMRKKNKNKDKLLSDHLLKFDSNRITKQFVKIIEKISNE